MTRRELLDKAAAKTCTNREDTFPQIAHFWGCEPLEVCIDMILLKVARIQFGQSVEDSLVDIAGYAACAAEIWEKDLNAQHELEAIAKADAEAKQKAVEDAALKEASKAYDLLNGLR